LPKLPTAVELRKLINIANYQFGPGVGKSLFDLKTRIGCSKKTGRIRHIYRGRKLVATLRPTDGLLALTLEGASLLLKMRNPPNVVTVRNDVSEYIRKGGDVFAKHVVKAPDRLRPAEEVIAVDEEGRLLGVGLAVLSSNDMRYFKRGVAIKIRRGVEG
jgi:predicted RNA-binding protein (TIGR00451 family)